MKFFYTLLSLISLVFGELEVEDIPELSVVSVSNSDYLDGRVFNDELFKGKVSILMYANSEEESKAKRLREALVIVTDKLESNFVQRYMIVNQGNSWQPDDLLEKIEKSKQEAKPEILYIKDSYSQLSDKWGLDHDTFVCMILNAKMEVVYIHKGEFSRKEIEHIAALIWDENKKVEEKENK